MPLNPNIFHPLKDGPDGDFDKERRPRIVNGRIVDVPFTDGGETLRPGGTRRVLRKPSSLERDLKSLPSETVKGGGGRDESKRLHVHLPAATVERLEAIKDYSEAPSTSAVIRHALQAYEMMITAERDGSKIVIENPDGTKYLIKLVI